MRIPLFRSACRHASRAALTVSTAMLALASDNAGAQSSTLSTCDVTPSTGSKPFDACQKVSDIFAFLAPQIGVAIAGGNAMLGESGALGGPRKLSLSLHATVVDGRVPSKNVNINPSGPAVSSNFGSQRAPVPMPSLDAAVGIWQGIPVGLTNVGGIDFLAGITYVPDVNKDPVSISTDGRSFAVSYGIRVGILQESAAVPGVSVSVRNRKMPTSSFLYAPNNDTLTVSGAHFTTQSIRVVAGKHYKFFGIAGGFGTDKVEADSRFSAVINDPPPLPRLSVSIPFAVLRAKRTNAFLNLSLGLPKAQVVGEIGWSRKGTIQETVNTFDNRQANEAYRYYSLGFSLRY